MSEGPTSSRRLLRVIINLSVLCAVLLAIRVVRPAQDGSEAGAVTVGGAAAGSPTSSAERRQALEQRPPMVQAVEDIEGIEDPAILDRAGRYHLAADNRDLARACFEASLLREELNHYTQLTRRDAFQALVHERMGETAEAEAAWQAGIEKDLHYNYLFCWLLSRAEDKSARLDAMRAEVLRRVEAAKAGESPHWYTTKKGASRKLELIDQDELVQRAQEVADGKAKNIRYVYVPEVDLATMPPDLKVQISRSVVGSLRGYGAVRTASFGFNGVIVDELYLGKKWLGTVNLSASIPPAKLGEVFLTDLIVMPDAHLEGVQFQGRNASFVFTIFEGEADFSAVGVQRAVDFRYSLFNKGANFRRAVFEGPVHFGHATFGGQADFSTMVSTTRRVYFNSMRFDDKALLEGVDWRQGGTLEDSTFSGPLVMSRGRFGARMNLSRARMHGGIEAREMVSDGMDFFGVELGGSSDFTDSVFDGHVRFSPDEVTYRDFTGRLDDLAKLYKMYQGDEDATEDLTNRTAYGVESIDDLTAYLPGNLSFANVMFQEFCQFQRVVFGEEGGGGSSNFYNAQFRGETHFERAVFHNDADFTTIFANELGLNDATFHGRVLLDDANVPGRVTMGGARFAGDADLSLYGAQITRFHISKDQLQIKKGRHRLFYEQCARGKLENVEQDPRIERAMASYRQGESRPDIVDLCYERLAEDFNVLGNAFAERGMAQDEDWAYWYSRHHETMHGLFHGGLGTRIGAFVRWFLFEMLFGWGVRLQNLGLAALFVVLLFGVLYKWVTPEAQIEFNGFDTSFRHLTYPQSIFVSLMSMLSMDIGWDIGRNKGFRWLNVTEVVLGIIILTFFVGAYTRLVLA